MSRALATAPAPASTLETEAAEVTISFDYQDGFSANPQTLVIQSGYQGSIVFKLDPANPPQFTFYDRGIVFQFPHNPFKHIPTEDGIATFSVDNRDAALMTYRYSVLLQDNSTTPPTVYFFDPTVQNDPPG